MHSHIVSADKVNWDKDCMAFGKKNKIKLREERKKVVASGNIHTPVSKSEEGGYQIWV